MPTNYILIDLENVQPKNLKILLGHPFKIYVFVGENQTKIPFDLALTMQSFGEDAKYIKLVGNGKNALDFHLAFYLGELKTLDPDGYFHIISKDQGFDPLVNHLKQQKIKIQRHQDLEEIQILRISNAKTTEEKVDAIIKNLENRGQGRPRKTSTLASTINSLLIEKLDEKQMTAFINRMKNKKFITIEQDKITYNIK